MPVPVPVTLTRGLSLREDGEANSTLLASLLPVPVSVTSRVWKWLSFTTKCSSDSAPPVPAMLAATGSRQRKRSWRWLSVRCYRCH